MMQYLRTRLRLYPLHMRAFVISVLVLIAASVSAAEPRIETFPVPRGHLPTEIARHGDVMTFVSWTNWPAIEPHLGRVTGKGVVTTAPLEKDHLPGFFAQAPDGSLWLSDARKPVLWRIHPGGKAEAVPITRTTLGIAVDADGAIWASHPEKGDVTRYGPEGNVQSQWFIGRRHGRSAAPSASIPKPRTGPVPIAPKKQGEVPLSKEERKKRTLDARPSWMTIGPDGALWFTEPTWRNIGRVTAGGEIRSFAYPAEWGEPKRIVAGADGALWFALTRALALGRVTTEGTITTIDLPYPAGTVAADAAGRIWFADATGTRLGYLDTEGKVHELPDSKVPRLIRSLAEGPDGAMWFADQASHVIGRISLDSPKPN